MIARLAHSITECWISADIVPREKAEIYEYGLDVTLSSAFITLLIATLSVLYGDILLAICYYACFYPLRGFCGGYHAKTHWGCALTQCVSFSMSVYASRWIGDGMPLVPALVMFTILFVLTVAFAPVEHPGNPLNNAKKKAFKTYGTITIVLSLAATLVLKYVGMTVYSNIVLLTCCISILSMIAAWIDVHIHRYSNSDSLPPS